MKKLLFAIAMCGILAACSSTTEDTSSNEQPKKEEVKPQKESKSKEETKTETKETTAQEEKKETTVDENDFNMYASNLTGSPFIATIALQDGNKAFIKYVDSFATYKAEKPNSSVTEDQYKSYFESGDAIEKIMVGEPARLLREFKGLESVSLKLPFEGKIYSTELTREELNNYLGFKIESLSPNNDSWRSKFSDQYIYNKAKRSEMFNKFVTVQ